MITFKEIAPFRLRTETWKTWPRFFALVWSLIIVEMFLLQSPITFFINWFSNWFFKKKKFCHWAKKITFLKPFWDLFHHRPKLPVATSQFRLFPSVSLSAKHVCDSRWLENPAKTEYLVFIMIGTLSPLTRASLSQQTPHPENSLQFYA